MSFVVNIISLPAKPPSTDKRWGVILCPFHPPDRPSAEFSPAAPLATKAGRHFDQTPKKNEPNQPISTDMPHPLYRHIQTNDRPNLDRVERIQKKRRQKRERHRSTQEGPAPRSQYKHIERHPVTRINRLGEFSVARPFIGSQTRPRPWRETVLLTSPASHNHDENTNGDRVQQSQGAADGNANRAKDSSWPTSRSSRPLAPAARFAGSCRTSRARPRPLACCSQYNPVARAPIVASRPRSGTVGCRE